MAHRQRTGESSAGRIRYSRPVRSTGSHGPGKPSRDGAGTLLTVSWSTNASTELRVGRARVPVAPADRVPESGTCDDRDVSGI